MRNGRIHKSVTAAPAVRHRRRKKLFHPAGLQDVHALGESASGIKRAGVEQEIVIFDSTARACRTSLRPLPPVGSRSMQAPASNSRFPEGDKHDI